jgi:acyl-CoA thioesterase FadM
MHANKPHIRNYLEHACHEYLRSLGLDFASQREREYDLALTRKK